MPLGPGKYGANAEQLLKTINAEMCLVILVGGPDGGAFDVATVNPLLIPTIPEVLRRTADNIEATLRGEQEPV
jgi:hypothetical protein